MLNRYYCLRGGKRKLAFMIDLRVKKSTYLAQYNILFAQCTMLHNFNIRWKKKQIPNKQIKWKANITTLLEVTVSFELTALKSDDALSEN